MFYTVFYRKTRNPHVSHWRCMSGTVGSVRVASLEEARELAKTREVTDVYTCTGRKVAL